MSEWKTNIPFWVLECEEDWKRKSGLTIKTLGTNTYQLNTQLMLLAAKFLLQLAFLHLNVTTYLAIFNWVWNDVRVRFRTLLRALLSSFVILLVTTHSDEQLGQSSFLIRRYIRVIWFTRNTRLRRIWPTRKQNRRTSVPTLSLRSHTLKWRPKFPACRSILIAKDCGHKILAGDSSESIPIISGSSFSAIGMEQ